jgi:hypothetical protein
LVTFGSVDCRPNVPSIKNSYRASSLEGKGEPKSFHRYVITRVIKQPRARRIIVVNDLPVSQALLGKPLSVEHHFGA